MTGFLVSLCVLVALVALLTSWCMLKLTTAHEELKTGLNGVSWRLDGLDKRVQMEVMERRKAQDLLMDHVTSLNGRLNSHHGKPPFVKGGGA